MGKQAAAWLQNKLNPSGRMPPPSPSDQVLVQAAGFAPRLRKLHRSGLHPPPPCRATAGKCIRVAFFPWVEVSCLSPLGPNPARFMILDGKKPYSREILLSKSSCMPSKQAQLIF